VAVLIGETILMMEGETAKVCPANKKWAKSMMQVLPIQSILKSEVLKGLLTCVGPELGYKIKVAKGVEEFERLKKELEAQTKEG
jgi:hypothetical protein